MHTPTTELISPLAGYLVFCHIPPQASRLLIFSPGDVTITRLHRLRLLRSGRASRAAPIADLGTTIDQWEEARQAGDKRSPVRFRSSKIKRMKLYAGCGICIYASSVFVNAPDYTNDGLLARKRNLVGNQLQSLKLYRFISSLRDTLSSVPVNVALCCIMGSLSVFTDHSQTFEISWKVKLDLRSTYLGIYFAMLFGQTIYILFILLPVFELVAVISQGEYGYGSHQGKR